MTSLSEPVAPSGSVRPTRATDVVVAVLLVVAELLVAWYTVDLATAVSHHLDPTRPVQWFFLMLPFVPLALVVAVRALNPSRALVAASAAVGGGLVQIAHYELLRWLSTHPSAGPSYDELRAVGYVVAMTVSVLAALAWGLSRRHGRRWPVGLLVAALGAALTLWTDWTAHTGWGRTQFVFTEGDDNPLRRAELMHGVALMLPVVAACVACWLVDRAELRGTAQPPAYDEGPPPR